MGRLLVLGALALAVLGAVLFALPRAPDPTAPRPDAATPAALVAPTSHVAPRPPQLDTPRAADVPAPPPLPATAAIHGRVTEHGRPVAGFPVELRTGAPHAVTDESGDFVLDKIEPGAHVLVAEDRKAGKSSPRTPIELAAGDDLDVDLAIAQTGRLRIEVVDLDGAPVLGVTVAVVGPAAAASYFPGESSTTDAAGAIERWGLTAGSLTVIAGGPAETLDVHGGQERTRIQVPRHGGKQIAGDVRDDRGEPIAGVEVTLEGQTTTTDAAGRFGFAHLLDTKYRLEAWMGTQDNHAQVDAHAGTMDAAIVLPRPATLDGTVSGFAHDPWIRLDGAHFAHASVHDGVIDHTVLAAGTYHLVAYGGQGGEISVADVVLAPGSATTLRLAPTATGSARVHAMRFPSGAVVAGAKCTSPFATSAITDAAGDALITELPPGRRVIACATSDAYGTATVIGAASATVDARVYVVEGAGHPAGPAHFGAILDDAAVFTDVFSGGAASVAGISAGDQLLAIDGVAITPENAGAAKLFIYGAKRPFAARVRSKGGSYAIDLNVTPQ